MNPASSQTQSAGPSRHRRFSAVTASGVLCLVLCLTGHLPAEELQTSQPSKIMAGYLHVFPAYVKWPTNTFADANDSWQVGVLGGNPFGNLLEETLLGTNHAVLGRSFEIWHAGRLEDLPGCQIIFFAFKDEANTKAALEKLDSLPVLTVGEAGNFLQLGGIIQLEQKRDRMLMSINLDRARASHLEIPAKMLEVASAVIENGELKKLK